MEEKNMSKQRTLSPNSIPQELVSKYHVNGPRYTSYPTALQFQNEFDRERVEIEWRKTNESPRKNLSLYIHIPFCGRRCLYCGCTTETGHSPQSIGVYIDSLKLEIEGLIRLIDADRPVEQFALGGGTPTSLSRDLMASLIHHIEEKFRFSGSAERSIEIDPRTVDPDYLDLLISLGFNRYSFGIQDLDASVQKQIGREMSESAIRSLLAHLRSSGVHSINLDLMYGLPLQTQKSFATTVDTILDMRPSRIALFGYAHVPWASPHQKMLETSHLPDSSERTVLFTMACEKLLDAGYRHVGMDHFALPGDELLLALDSKRLTRNFMGYTARGGLDLAGLGASSISSVGATYTQNLKTVSGYVSRSQNPPWWKAIILTPEDILRRDIILGLLCNFHLDIRAIECRGGIDFFGHFAPEKQNLDAFVSDGLLTIDPETIEVTDLGKFFIRNICMQFDQYFDAGSASAKYSKTI
jgi:oxygen-independent coproporphyrinogen III oxidase